MTTIPDRSTPDRSTPDRSTPDRLTPRRHRHCPRLRVAALGASWVLVAALTGAVAYALLVFGGR